MEHYKGDIYAILTAVTWSVAVIFFKLSGTHLGTIPLKIFQNVAAVILFFFSIIIIGEPLTLTLTFDQWVRVAASAFIGITLGDTFYLAAINRIGAGPQALVDGLYMPFVMVLAYFMFGEHLSIQILFGASLVMVAIFIAHLDLLKSPLPRRHLWSGVTFAILSQLAMAACVVMVKDLLVTQALLTITAYRFLIGTVALIAYYVSRGFWRESLAGFRPSRSWRVTLTGSILGPFVATLFWFAGFKYTLAGKAAVYNQLSTILIILLAAVFLGERLTKNRIVAVVVALAGGLLVLSS